MAQENDTVLQTIIEKAREREAALVNMDWRYKMRMYNPKTPESQNKVTGHDLASGVKFLREGYLALESPNQPASGGAVRLETASAGDGVIWRELNAREGRTPTAEVRQQPQDADWMVNQMVLLRRLGTVCPPDHPATLADLLEADTDKLAEKYAGQGLYTEQNLSVSLKGQENISGRDCWVVELRFAGMNGNFSRTDTLYFDPELDYCMVASQSRTKGAGLFSSTAKYEMSDFREVKPGVRVPFAARAELASFSLYRDAQLRETVLELETESLELPAFIDDEAFKLRFPAGTKVTDNIAGIEYVVEDGHDLELPALEALDIEETPQPAVEPPAEAVEVGTVPADDKETATAGEPKGFPVVLIAIVAAVLAAAAALALRARRARGR